MVARVDKMGLAQATDELQKFFCSLRICYEILLSVTIEPIAFDTSACIGTSTLGVYQAAYS